MKCFYQVWKSPYVAPPGFPFPEQNPCPCMGKKPNKVYVSSRFFYFCPSGSVFLLSCDLLFYLCHLTFTLSEPPRCSSSQPAAPACPRSEIIPCVPIFTLSGLFVKPSLVSTFIALNTCRMSRCFFPPVFLQIVAASLVSVSNLSLRLTAVVHSLNAPLNPHPPIHLKVKTNKTSSTFSAQQD